jgi:hypothetical protein
MTVYVIGYDLHPTKGETYEELTSAIRALGNCLALSGFHLARRFKPYGASNL